MKSRRIDKVFLAISSIIILAGFFILASASMGLLSREGVRFSTVILKQGIVGLGGGLVMFLIASRVHYKNWAKIALPLFALSFLASLLVFEPHIGFEHAGAKRWISLGLVTFQPAEFLKFAFIIYLASWISARKNDIGSFKFGLAPFVLIVSFVGAVLVLQPDLGTLTVILATSGFMFFIGGGKFKQIAILFLLGAVLLAALAFLKPHAMSRIMVFIDPSLDPQGIGYQMKQSLIAIGSGGIFGRGFGMSIQKFNYLPEPVGDSIFAVFAEEFGFAGSLFLVTLFLLFLYRGFKIVLAAPDSFARLLGSGIVILIVVQSFINIGAMSGIIPLTGMPLIFVSQGGSAFAFALAELGVLLNISKYRKQ